VVEIGAGRPDLKVGPGVEGLRSGIGDVAGMGGKKRADFFSRLVDLVYGLREGHLSSGSLASRFPLVVDGDTGARDPVKATMAYEFHEDVLSLGIGVLHAGAKTKALIAAGYRNIGDLAAVGSSTLIALPGMGQSTVRKIKKSAAKSAGRGGPSRQHRLGPIL